MKLFAGSRKFEHLRSSRHHIFALALSLLFVSSSCGGGNKGVPPSKNQQTAVLGFGASISGKVADGYVNGAVVTVYNDSGMASQLGSGASNAFGDYTDLPLASTVIPSPIYIKSHGGVDVATGMIAPSTILQADGSGSAYVNSPITTSLFRRSLLEGLTAAKTSLAALLGIAETELFGDPVADSATLASPLVTSLASGTLGSSLSEGSYKMHIVSFTKDEVSATSISSINAIFSNNLKTFNVTVDSEGNLSGGNATDGYVTGKAQGDSVLVNILDNLSNPGTIIRYSASLGLMGSMAGTMSHYAVGADTMKAGLFAGTFVPASTISLTALNTYLNSFYAPGSGTGTQNIVFRQVFNNDRTPRVYWGSRDILSLDASAGTITMGDFTGKIDSGSSAGSDITIPFVSGLYYQSGTSPTNLIVSTDDYSAVGTGDVIYTILPAGSRRGIFIHVSRDFFGGGTNIIKALGDIYFSKSGNALAPYVKPTAATAYAMYIVSPHLGMIGRSRADIVASLPEDVGPVNLPNMSSTSWFDATNSFGSVTQLIASQGSMMAFKKDDDDDFADTTRLGVGTVNDYLWLFELFETGAFQGDEISGGSVSWRGATSKIKEFPSTMVGLLVSSTPTEVFTGKLNFIGRTLYGDNYAGFLSDFLSGTITITVTNAELSLNGGSSIPLVFRIERGIYHLYGAVDSSRYLDLYWPQGATRAAYIISDGYGGTVSAVGSASLTF